MSRRLLIVVAVAVGLVGLLAGNAPAQAPDAQGWWWFAQTSGLPVSAPTPPWVAADGLYVAANPTGTEAISAVRLTLSEGASVTSLTLNVSDTRGTPVVGACRASKSWQPVQGGPIADAPGCEGTAVAGTVAADGTSVTFPVAGLVNDTDLDIAIVPGADPSGAPSTFQLAFTKPGEDAFAVTAAPVTDSGTAAPAPAPEPAAPAETPFVPVLTPAPVVPIDLPPPSITPTTPPVALTPPTPARSSDDDARTNTLKVIGWIALAGTAVAYHRLSRLPDREPRSLVTFGSPPS